MKKFISTIGTILAVSWLLTSCLESETVELSPNASITSFSINDITTIVPAKTEDGRDTTNRVVLNGDLYAFAIDHVNGLIYNTDSLPLGTDVTAVTVNLGFEGGYALYGDEEPRLYSKEDSIDFTRPVKFSIWAADGKGVRNYYASVNVHKTDVNSLVWQTVESNFPYNRMTAEKAVVSGDNLMVFGQTAEGAAYTVSPITDGKNWTSPTLLDIPGSVDYASITQYKNTLYLMADGKLFSSTDGCTNWVAECPEQTFITMIGAVDDELHVVTDGYIVSSPLTNAIQGETTITNGWDTIQTVDVQTFPASPWKITTPLPTNPNINRTILVGAPKDYTGNTACVWAKLTTEEEWTAYGRIAGNKYECPLLENLTVIPYNNNLYAFGGASKDGKTEAFEAIFISTDGGITWQKNTKNIGLPAELKGNNEPFACIVDNSYRIWIIPYDGGRLYKGYMHGQRH